MFESHVQGFVSYLSIFFIHLCITHYLERTIYFNDFKKPLLVYIYIYHFISTGLIRCEWNIFGFCMSIIHWSIDIIRLFIHSFSHSSTFLDEEKNNDNSPIHCYTDTSCSCILHCLLVSFHSYIIFTIPLHTTLYYAILRYTYYYTTLHYTKQKSKLTHRSTTVRRKKVLARFNSDANSNLCTGIVSILLTHSLSIRLSIRLPICLPIRPFAMYSISVLWICRKLKRT